MTQQLTGPEYAKMIAGELYSPEDPELVTARARARRLEFEFNHTAPDLGQHRASLIRDLFGTVGESFEIEPMFHCDYGCNIHIGQRFYANANCVLLDVAEIRIGDDVMLAPGVGLFTATHPVDAKERTSGRELGFPIRIGSRVWLGGGAIVGPGITIGDDVVVGAGSVVVKDLPDRVVAVGNPARIIKHL